MGTKSDKKLYLPRASFGRGFVPPRYSTVARRFMILVGGSYLRILEGVKSVELHQAERLLDELELFYQGDHRLIIAFRHVAKEDAPVMIYALNKKLQKLIRRRNAGKPAGMKIIPHANFLYGKDVLNWAGKAAAWLFPKIGCVPVQNRGNNRKGLQILREHMRTGTFPIALAPESQVTYHMYTCSDISAGVSSLAAWGEESTKDVTIIPVAIGYRHFKAPDAGIRSVLARWEKQTGMQLRDLESSPVLMLLQEATDKTLSLLEELYNISPPSSQNQRERILIICETALQRAEHLAQQAPEGDLLDRLFRIRYCGVDAIYPESFDPKALPPLGRSIADFHALEAHVYVRHSQIVDVLQYLDPASIAAPCSAGRAG